MRRLLRWIASTLAAGFLAAVVFGPFGEFFIEWAREERWYEHPSQRVDATMMAFNVFVTQTWFLVVTAFIVGLAIGMWIDALLRRREVQPSPLARPVPIKLRQEQEEEEEGEEEEETPADAEARHDLMLFALDYILPACESQIALQDAIIDLTAFGDKPMQWTIRQSVRHDEKIMPFCTSVRKLAAGLGGSPLIAPPLDELINHVETIEKGYAIFRRETDELASSRGMDYKNHSVLMPLWRKWHEEHNTLVEKYDVLKRDRRFPKLFRPGRPSRWGDPIRPDEP